MGKMRSISLLFLAVNAWVFMSNYESTWNVKMTLSLISFVGFALIAVMSFYNKSKR